LQKIPNIKLGNWRLLEFTGILVFWTRVLLIEVAARRIAVGAEIVEVHGALLWVHEKEKSLSRFYYGGRRARDDATRFASVESSTDGG